MAVREGWRFERTPEADTDEDGEHAFVAITTMTQTPEDALAWLAGHVEQIGWSPESETLVVDRVQFDGLYCNIDAAVATLHDTLALRSLIVSGRVQAWWRFEVYGARDLEPDVDFDERIRIRTEEAEAEQRRRLEWGAPRWWHAQVRWAARLKRWGTRLDPKDRTSAYIMDGGQFTMVENLRRPKGEED